MRPYLNIKDIVVSEVDVPYIGYRFSYDNDGWPNKIKHKYYVKETRYNGCVWSIFIKKFILSPDAFEKYIYNDKYVYQRIIYEYQYIPMKVIKKYLNIDKINYINWDYLCMYQTLPEDFIEKYEHKVSWKNIFKYQKLSISFIEKHIFDHPYWGRISSSQRLTIPFIEKYYYYVDWALISKFQKLDEYFIEKHKHRINWQTLMLNKNLSDDIKNKYRHKLQ